MQPSHRDTLFIGLRPTITVDADRDSLPEENFQQTALRPILKLQHQLLFGYFKEKTATAFISEVPTERMVFIENTIRKDAVLRNQLIGMIIGLFTVDEFAFYLEHASALNKRIARLLIQRIQDGYHTDQQAEQEGQRS